jgi:hypothetical protein
MKISPETKKYLYIGGSIIVAVGVGIYAYRKYQSNTSASEAAANQESQDEQSLDELVSAGYGAGDTSIGEVSASPPGINDNFAQEVTSILQAAGLDQVNAATPAAPASLQSSSSPSGTPTPTGGTTVGTPKSSPSSLNPAPPIIKDEGEQIY